MTRFLMTVMVVGAMAAPGASGRDDLRPQAANPVVAWNRTLLSIVRTAGAQPPTIHPTRSFAILHAAIYDAVNAIERTHAPYLGHVRDVSRRASADAAAHAAAHDVLVALYPAFRSTLDAQLDASRLTERERGGREEGARVGREVAAQILAARQQDGASAPPNVYVFGSAPGDYQSTPPNFPAQPQFTHWSFVTPFALRHADQFRPPHPPALASDRYADALAEVASIGVVNSTTATPDEAEIGTFWNGAIQNYWNEIAQTVSIADRLSTADSARLFALLNLSLADSVIAFYDAKYTYNRWRPVTAIRSADLDDNPDTVADPNWLPEGGKTAPDPSYPGAHAVISAAAAKVLRSVRRRDRIALDVTSEVMPGVVRSFTRLSAAADEASDSRIFAGQHFRFDEESGERLGRDVADFVLDHFLTHRRHRDDDDRDRFDDRR